MVMIVEKIKLPEQYDRRVKLTQSQKEEIRKRYNNGEGSLRYFAKKYGVSKRTIQFIVNPEKYEKAKQQFKERRKDGRYKPSREERTRIMREHRSYKKKLLENGLINLT